MGSARAGWRTGMMLAKIVFLALICGASSVGLPARRKRNALVWGFGAVGAFCFLPNLLLHVGYPHAAYPGLIGFLITPVLLLILRPLCPKCGAPLPRGKASRPNCRRCGRGG